MSQIEGASKPVLPCPATKLIPHRSPMLLIDQLVERSDDKKHATATTSLNSKLLYHGADNSLSPEFFIEIIAQTTAAAKGYDDLQNNEKLKAGFLVGIDEFSLTGSSTTNDQLRIEIEKMFEFGDITIFIGKLFNDTTLLAVGKIQVWEKVES